METITTNQLKLYDNILEEINAQHELSGKLKQEIEKDCNKIVALKIALANDLRLCHCGVKVFDSVYELYSLFKAELGPDSLSAFSNYVGCKFYLVELYISNILLDIFKDYYLTITMYSDTTSTSTNRTIKPSTKGLIYEVLPISEAVLDIWVEVRLSFPSEDSWIVLKLFRKQINILHHFIKHEDKKTHSSRMQKYVNLNRCYSDRPESIINLPFLEYKLNCDLPRDKFIELFLSNCYHRLDIRLFAELSNDNTDKPVTITISFRYNNKCTVSYDRRRRSVRFKCHVDDLYLMKKMLVTKVAPREDISGDLITPILQKLATKKFHEHTNVSEVHAVQEERRKIIFDLPF